MNRRRKAALGGAGPPVALVCFRAAVVAAVAMMLVGVGACSSSSSPTEAAGRSALPTAVAAFPTVQGAYGRKPRVVFPNARPTSTLQVKRLLQGHGAVVKNSDLLVTNYLGQIWGGRVFDNTYDRKAPLGTAIGVGAVIPGWDKALVGQRIGSRVLLVVPPSDGYGPSGNPDIGVTGSDTLVFVLDLIASYSKTAVGDKTAAVAPVTTAPVTVKGALGAPPKITIARRAAVPKAVRATVLARAKGRPLKPGLAILQYEAVYFDGTVVDSTFVRGQPQAAEVGPGAPSGPFNILLGVPIGSRVLIVTPARSASTQAPTGIALVVDVVAEIST